jgi:RNase P subunit RPR2
VSERLVRGKCPRCRTESPPVKVTVRSTGPASVTLNLRCQQCYDHGHVVYYDVPVSQIEGRKSA